MALPWFFLIDEHLHVTGKQGNTYKQHICWATIKKGQLYPMQWVVGLIWNNYHSYPSSELLDNALLNNGRRFNERWLKIFSISWLKDYFITIRKYIWLRFKMSYFVYISQILFLLDIFLGLRQIRKVFWSGDTPVLL